jgi:hypothetical protein
MIVGITASGRSGGSVPPAYQASGVVFGGTTTLVNSALSSTDNHLVSFAGWFKPSSADFTGTGVTFVVDPSGDYYTFVEFQSGTVPLVFVASGTGRGEFDYSTVGSLNPPLSAGAWLHIIGTFDGLGSSPWAGQIYVNDVRTNLTTSGTSTNIVPKANGLPFWVGGDGQGDPFGGSMADFSFWPGISFIESGGDILPATRRLFIDASGAPVHPSAAIAALGAPAVMLSGGASSFPSNSLGGSGSFATTTGGLTNDASLVHA